MTDSNNLGTNLLEARSNDRWVATASLGRRHVAAAAHGAEIKIAGQAAVLMETRGGKILWQRNQDLSLAPASTTKILTALVVLERSKASDIVTIPAEATLATGGTVHLQTGERLSVEQLLYGMMLGSANDAAIALATHAGGSVEKFVGLMNDKARIWCAPGLAFAIPPDCRKKAMERRRVIWR